MNLIHNERLKLLATAMNNVAIAVVVTGAVAPVLGSLYGIEQRVPTWRVAAAVATSLLAGGGLHLLATWRIIGLLRE